MQHITSSESCYGHNLGLIHIYLPIVSSPPTGLAVRVFANGSSDRGSIPGRVIPKTQKWYLMPPWLTLINIKRYVSRVKWSNTEKGIAPFPTPRCVTYWPSTEPSIKRSTWVNKRKNRETGASGRRYRNITLTCGHGRIRWWLQMRTLTWSRWATNKDINRCHRRLESIRVPVGVRMPAEWEPAPDRGLEPSVTHGLVAQPKWERRAAIVRRTLGQYVAVCPRLQVTSHTQPTSKVLREAYFL